MTILNASVSGMLADSNWLSSISQNVANANTTGYKNSETEFETLVDQAANGTSYGGGVMTSMRSLNSLQGAVVSSTTPTSLAVQGAGFFVVSDAGGAVYLTRNGSFVPDASGNLVNSAGYYLMGANAQSGSPTFAANSLDGLQKVNVVSAGQIAAATTSGSLTANLPATATPVAAANLPSTNSATSTYTDQTSLVMYDNLGGAHTINLYFANTGPGSWEVDAFDSSQASAGGGFPYASGPLATQTLTFNPLDGTLTSGSPLSIRRSERPDNESRSQQHVAAGDRLQRDGGDRQRQRSEQHQRRVDRPDRNLVVRLHRRNLEARLRHSARQRGQSGQSDVRQRQRLSCPRRPPDRYISEPLAAAASASSTPLRSKSSTVDLATELTAMIQAQSAYEANSKVFQTGANILDVLNGLKP